MKVNYFNVVYLCKPNKILHFSIQWHLISPHHAFFTSNSLTAMIPSLTHMRYFLSTWLIGAQKRFLWYRCKKLWTICRLQYCVRLGNGDPQNNVGIYRRGGEAQKWMGRLISILLVNVLNDISSWLVMKRSSAKRISVAAIGIMACGWRQWVWLKIVQKPNANDVYFKLIDGFTTCQIGDEIVHIRHRSCFPKRTSTCRGNAIMVSIKYILQYNQYIKWLAINQIKLSSNKHFLMWQMGNEEKCKRNLTARELHPRTLCKLQTLHVPRKATILVYCHNQWTFIDGVTLCKHINTRVHNCGGQPRETHEFLRLLMCWS